MVLVNCLNMACQIATRMTMLKKGPGVQWRHLVYSDLPISITVVLTRWRHEHVQLFKYTCNRTGNTRSATFRPATGKPFPMLFKVKPRHRFRFPSTSSNARPRATDSTAAAGTRTVRTRAAGSWTRGPGQWSSGSGIGTADTGGTAGCLVGRHGDLGFVGHFNSPTAPSGSETTTKPPPSQWLVPKQESDI